MRLKFQRGKKNANHGIFRGVLTNIHNRTKTAQNRALGLVGGAKARRQARDADGWTVLRALSGANEREMGPRAKDVVGWLREQGKLAWLGAKGPGMGRCFGCLGSQPETWRVACPGTLGDWAKTQLPEALEMLGSGEGGLGGGPSLPLGGS